MSILSEIQVELKAPKSQYNAFGKYHYRSCEDILEAVKPFLLKHGVSVIIADDIIMIGNRYYVKAAVTLYDADGKYLAGTTAFARESESRKGMDESQITGSASSYARKYALSGLFAIQDEKDADSNNTHEEPKKEYPPPSPAQSSLPAKGTIDRFFKVMGSLKEEVGDQLYYQVLKAHGFSHANEIKTSDKKNAVVDDLKKERARLQKEEESWPGNE